LRNNSSKILATPHPLVHVPRLFTWLLGQDRSNLPPDVPIIAFFGWVATVENTQGKIPRFARNDSLNEVFAQAPASGESLSKASRQLAAALGRNRRRLAGETWIGRAACAAPLSRGGSLRAARRTALTPRPGLPDQQSLFADGHPVKGSNADGA